MRLGRTVPGQAEILLQSLATMKKFAPILTIAIVVVACGGSSSTKVKLANGGIFYLEKEDTYRSERVYTENQLLGGYPFLNCRVSGYVGMPSGKKIDQTVDYILLYSKQKLAKNKYTISQKLFCPALSSFGCQFLTLISIFTCIN